MKTLTTILSALLMISLGTHVSAQGDLLATQPAMTQVDFDNSSIAERSTFEVHPTNERVYFKVNMRNGQTTGVVILERSVDGDNFDVLKFKKLLPVASAGEILYCFNDEVAADDVVYYRITVATEETTETLGTYKYGTEGENFVTEKRAIVTTTTIN